MKKGMILLVAGLLAGTACMAQDARTEIMRNPRMAGSNHTAYVAPTEALTPAPAGYEPFYMTHYGRHGSRWLCGAEQYTVVIDVLKKAERCGKLSDMGKGLLKTLEEFNKTAKDRAGDLTTVGERQHHGIGRRMTEHFPEVFSDNAQVDARSSFVMRCVLSMMAECEEIAAFNPQVTFHNDVGACFQYYLDPNGAMTKEQKAMLHEGTKLMEAWRQQHIHPAQLCGRLFSDIEWAYLNINAVAFMENLFTIATNMQSHDDGADIFTYFNDEEIYDMWTIKNVQSYLSHGNAKETKGLMPFVAAPLLRNMLETADTILKHKDYRGATLRFGHEVDLMPLACLMELGNCDTTVRHLEDLEKVWFNSHIYPMAGNIQLVFYRGGKGKPILVKALLNEQEVRLPIATQRYPYYEWDKLRDYYMKKLENK